MKLERIHIEHYGAWRNLDLPVDSEAISVFFGPNEAGKTTLMRFIRGVLYGFDAHDWQRLHGAESGASWGGSLQVRHKNESWIVRRVGKVGTRGLVTASRIDGDGSHESCDGSGLVRDLVGNVSETVYENVLAIGLPELQALATLEADEVAEHIYSVSMGVEGRRLLQRIDEVRRTRSEILDLEHNTGELTEHHQQLDEIDRQLGACDVSRRKYGELGNELSHCEETIVDLKRRQQGLEEQLRGHEFMDLVWKPWRKVRHLENELARLPSIPDFPKDGLNNLKSIDAELAALRNRCRTLTKEVKAIRARRRSLDINPELRRYAPTLQSLVDQRDWIAELVNFADHTSQQLTGIRAQISDHVQRLGPDWNIERLRGLATGHLESACLYERARDFHTAALQTRRIRRRYQQLSAKCHRRQKLLDQARRQLGHRSLREAAEAARKDLTRLEDLSRLRIREAELQQRKVGIANQLHRLLIDPTLPHWVSAVFLCLAGVGLVLGVVGLSTGLETSFVAGMAYFMLGVCCEGLTWALKRHFEGEVRQTANRLRGEVRELELRLAETRDAMQRLLPDLEPLQLIEKANPPPHCQPDKAPANSISAGMDPPCVELPGNYAEGDTHSVRTEWNAATNHATTVVTTIGPAATSRRSPPAVIPTASPQAEESHESESSRPKSTPTGAPDVAEMNRLDRNPARHTSEADLVRLRLERLQQLERLLRMEEWVMRTRQKLIHHRARLREQQRDFGTARQCWTAHLAGHGLDETVIVDDALEQRDAVARTSFLIQRIDALQGDRDAACRLLQRYSARIEELGHLIQKWRDDYSNPLAVLDAWKDELTALADQLHERRRLRREFRSRQWQLATYRAKIRKLESRQSALLVRGGAVSSSDFESRAQRLERRFELEEQLAMARRELERVASTDSTLAVVESDLQQFDPQHNQQAIETIRQELNDVSTDLEQALHRLGVIRREIGLLEQDNSAAELRFEREQVLSKITELAEEWFALEWSLNTLESLRIEFERNHQTPILQRAREYLRRLSGGRYERIWTPLGERALCVDDRTGETIRVENLSSGAQEQLFLAIRLALIEHFAQQGFELPVVLDDVLVNFDQERTRAAVEELLLVASKGQQILFFTCHQHLSEMFRQRGIGTVMLPARENSGLLAG